MNKAVSMGGVHSRVVGHDFFQLLPAATSGRPGALVLGLLRRLFLR